MGSSSHLKPAEHLNPDGINGSLTISKFFGYFLAAKAFGYKAQDLYPGIWWYYNLITTTKWLKNDTPKRIPASQTGSQQIDNSRLNHQGKRKKSKNVSVWMKVISFFDPKGTELNGL